MTETTNLTGSEKQIAWATSIRGSVIAHLNDPYDPQTEYIAKARLITNSSWWIDNRHLAAGGARATLPNIKAAIRSGLRQTDGEDR